MAAGTISGLQIINHAYGDNMENTTDAPQNIDVFIGKLNTAIDAISEQVIKVAPDAAEMIVGLVQFKGAFSLAVGLILIALLFVFMKICTKRLFSWSYKHDDNTGLCWAVTSFAHMPFILFAAHGLGKVLSFNNWLSLLYPEAALAYKALEAVGVYL